MKHHFPSKTTATRNFSRSSANRWQTLKYINFKSSVWFFRIFIGFVFNRKFYSTPVVVFS